jgi:glycosyltransferase involved in cell wall biosynthesis
MQKDEPLVSIIMSVFNGQDFLPFSISSVINQTYKNWELIIINDGSQDGSEPIILNFMRIHPRIKYIKHEVNRGLAASMNTGITQSRGQIIAFLEQDDLWLKDDLQEKVKLFRLNENLLYVSSLAFLFDQKKKRIFGISPGNFSAWMFAKKLFDKTGLFDESKDLAGVEDQDFMVRLGLERIKGEIHESFSFLVKRPLVIWVRHEKSLSAHTNENLKSLERKYRGLLKKYSSLEAHSGFQGVLACWHNRLGFNLCLQDYRQEGLQHFLKAIKLKGTMESLMLISSFWIPGPFQARLYNIFQALLRIYKETKLKLKVITKFKDEYEEALSLIENLKN